MKRLSELIVDLPVRAVSGDVSVGVAGITHDSRRAGPGVLFTAYAGVNQDVHRYLPDAVARGAAAALVERPALELRREHGLPTAFPLVEVPDARLARALAACALYDHPSRDLCVVGVTGTDGKTTTATLIHAVLEAAGRRTGLVSTVAARIGSESLDTGLHVTTPEPEDLQAYLAEMRDSGAEVAVLEVTSHGLAQNRTAGIVFDVGVLTNITSEALEYHGTFAAYRDAKAILFQALADPGLRAWRSRPGSWPANATSVLNLDDASGRLFADTHSEHRITYAVSDRWMEMADVTAKDVRTGPDGTRFVAETPEGGIEIVSPLVGMHNVANMLAAIATGVALGASADAVRKGIVSVGGIPGRMEVLKLGQPYMAIVDFAHTPNALESALRTARMGTGGHSGRLIAVFGCAGLRDPGKRAAMGRISGSAADHTIVTAEDPRTEDLAAIMREVAAGLKAAGASEAGLSGGIGGNPGRTPGTGASYELIPDRAEAIRAACEVASPGDVVIVCGKGHEQSMCFGQTEYPWDDRRALRAAIEGRAQPNRLPTSAEPA